MSVALHSSKRVKFQAFFAKILRIHIKFSKLCTTHYARVTNLEHPHDDFEQYGRHLRVRVEDTPPETKEASDKVLEKVENILK